jgi:hypothetical protein
MKEVTKVSKSTILYLKLCSVGFINRKVTINDKHLEVIKQMTTKVLLHEGNNSDLYHIY